MTVTFLSPFVSRAGGGIYEVERHLAHALRRTTSTSIEVVGLDYEFGSEEQAEWAPLEPRVLPVKGPSAFGYTPDLVEELVRTDPDLVHLHSLWMYTSVAARGWARRTGKPHLVTVHGMLDDWALHNAHWKKRLAGWLYEHANLEEAACIQVFHDDERRAVREYGVDTPICVVPNGVTLPEDRSPARPPPWEGQIPEDRHVLLFLGRIHPKKGLQELVEAWSQVQSDCPDASSWTLAIVGWDDGGHRPDLERYVRKAGLSSSVVFPGPQFGSDKAAAFADADAFILPSHSEGLPMAVLEAWSYRLPVVMTAECNLPEGFEESAALQVSPDPASIAEGLERLFDRSGNERSALGERGRTLVQRKFTWPSVARQMHEVYRWMLGKRKAPSCVRFG